MRKRGNGEGSIYHVEGRGYRANIVVGRKADGKLDRKEKTFELKAEAVRWLNEEVRKKAKGIVTAPDKLTVGDYALTWLREVVEPGGNSNTYEYYEGTIRNHITPEIGAIRLNDLRSEHVRSMLNKKRAAGFSPSTVQVVHRTMKTFLNWGVEERVIERNVAMFRTKDDKQVEDDHRGESFSTLDGFQIARLLAFIETHPWRCFIIVAMMLGIRRGEVLALRWQDIDFEGGWITLSRAITRVRVKRLKEQPANRFSGAGSSVKSLKNSKSIRALEMSETLRDALLQRQDEQAKERKKAGKNWREQDYIFTSENGDHWHPCTPTSVWASIRKEVELAAPGAKNVRLHDLRHSLATAMLKRGTPREKVQQQLGHSSPQMTGKYQHWFPGDKMGIADSMEQFIADGKKTLEARRGTERVAVMKARKA